MTCRFALPLAFAVAAILARPASAAENARDQTRRAYLAGQRHVHYTWNGNPVTTILLPPLNATDVRPRRAAASRSTPGLVGRMSRRPSRQADGVRPLPAGQKLVKRGSQEWRDAHAQMLRRQHPTWNASMINSALNAALKGR